MKQWLYIIGALLIALWAMYNKSKYDAAQEQERKQGQIERLTYQQYQEIRDKEPWVVLDIDVFERIADIAGDELNYGFPDHTIDWKTLLGKIEQGTVDATGGAVKTEARQKWAHFTTPYRIKEDVAYMRQDSGVKEFEDVDAFLSYAMENKLKVGVIESFAFASKRLTEVVRDPKNSAIFINAPSDIENMNGLKAKELDAIITNRLRGTQMLKLPEYQDSFKEYRIKAVVPVHFLISKKTITVEQVSRLNRAIAAIKDSGWLQEQTSKVPGA